MSDEVDDFEALWEETVEEVRRMSVEEWKEAMEEAERRWGDVYPLVVSGGDALHLEETDDAEDDVPEDIIDRAMKLFVARYHYWRL